MPSIEFMRNEVMKLGKSQAWARKVRRMSDNQIMAIYMKEQDKKKPIKERPPQKEEPF